jgi:hypothetical protein
MAPRKNITALFLFVLCLASISGCAPSYPKGELTESVEKVLKDEYNLTGKAQFTGKTLYLNTELEGLTDTEKTALEKAIKTVQNAMLTVTRVALSSDADIEYLIVDARDPNWGLSFRLIQRFQDVKGLLYHKISRSDYQGRIIIEIETDLKQNELSRVPPVKYDMRLEEFVGRLIVSQVNMLTRSNPFMAVLLNNSQLSYKDYTEDALIIGISSTLDDSVKNFFEKLVMQEAEEVFKKYQSWKPERIEVRGMQGQSFTISFNTAQF